MADLFHYFDVAEKVVSECKELSIDEESLKAYCIAWQWGTGVRKSKNTKRRRWAEEQEQFCLEIAEGLHQQESEDIQKEVYSRLDKIIQSSALVECIFDYTTLFKYHKESCNPRAAQSDYALPQSSALS